MYTPNESTTTKKSSIVYRSNFDHLVPYGVLFAQDKVPHPASSLQRISAAKTTPKLGPSTCLDS